MLLLVCGIAAAFGAIALTAFSLLSLVNHGAQNRDEAYRETGNGEAFLNEEPA